MKVFVDEDTGAGLGRALAAVRVDATFVARDRSVKPGTPDEIWMPLAGREGRLVFSRNIQILLNDTQRQMLIDHRVGFVFLPQHLSPQKLLTLVLRYWDKLEQLDAQQPRPFAFWLGVTGRLAPLPLDGSRAPLRRKKGGLTPRTRKAPPSRPPSTTTSRARVPTLPLPEPLT